MLHPLGSFRFVKTQTKQCKMIHLMRGPRSKPSRENNNMHVSSGEQQYFKQQWYPKMPPVTWEYHFRHTQWTDGWQPSPHLQEKTDKQNAWFWVILLCLAFFPPKNVPDSNYNRLRWLSIRAWYNQNQWICHCLITVALKEDRPIK